MSHQDSPENTSNPFVNNRNGRQGQSLNLTDNQSRRSFMSKAGGLTAMAIAASMVPAATSVGGKGVAGRCGGHHLQRVDALQ